MAFLVLSEAESQPPGSLDNVGGPGVPVPRASGSTQGQEASPGGGVRDSLGKSRGGPTSDPVGRPKLCG